MDEAVYACSLPLSPIIVFYDLDYLGDVKEIQIQIQVLRLWEAVIMFIITDIWFLYNIR